MARCKFCGKNIAWLKDGRKFIPLEDDGTTHDCEEKKNSLNSMKSMGSSSLTPEEIAAYEAGINLANSTKKKK